MTYSQNFDQALVWAHELHRFQTRKGKDVPYINHLMAVASLVGSNGGNETQVIAALLHDAIEDCVDKVPDIRAQILERFGPGVLEIVEACTDADTHPRPPWAARKQAYMDRLHAHNADAPALLVSLADKVHNAATIARDLRAHGPAFWDTFTAGQAGSLWYYRALSNIFSARCPGYLAGELRRLVDEMAQTVDPAHAAAPIYFFHGLESGPHGSKYQRLTRDFRIYSPDFRRMDIFERLEKIEVETRGMQDLIVVGSSYGGLLAALLYSRHPDRFRGYVLMAPAFTREAAEFIERMPPNATVIHARQDDVVPIGPVREMCAAHHIQLVEVDDDHRLKGAQELMVAAVRSLTEPG